MISIAVYGAYLLSSLGEELFLVVLLFHRSVVSMGSLQQQYQAMCKSEVFYNSVKEFINTSRKEKEQTNEPNGLAISLGPGGLKVGIAFDVVEFSYGSKSVLDSVSFSIPANKFTLFFGSSGTGKTTIIDLLCGLHQPLTGSIRIDGHVLTSLDISTWRRQIGYVPQECLLFNDNIRNNITLKDPRIGQQDILSAIEYVGLSSFIDSLEGGLNAPVGERGLKLSGGQRQRLSIARAMVHHPKVLILDEATASLDPDATEEICNMLKGLLRKGLTIVAISHQPFMMGMADMIYQLKDGHVAQVDKSDDSVTRGVQ